MRAAAAARVGAGTVMHVCAGVIVGVRWLSTVCVGYTCTMVTLGVCGNVVFPVLYRIFHGHLYVYFCHELRYSCLTLTRRLRYTAIFDRPSRLTEALRRRPRDRTSGDVTVIAAALASVRCVGGLQRSLLRRAARAIRCVACCTGGGLCLRVVI